ncbi:MAG: hypothetical protein NTY19_31695 [Planctomycetota bacterium]|nr:hypothetical protein [Planctomycetota bacterium]
MIYGIDDFVDLLLVRKGIFALVSWEHRPAMLALLTNLKRSVRRTERTIRTSLLSGENLVAEQFVVALHGQLKSQHASATVLVLYDLETLLDGAGRILNGLREQLRCFRAVILVLRENRRGDLFAACPDFMDWFGPIIYYAEALSRPFTPSDVRRAIRSFEAKHGMSSKDFSRKWESGQGTGIDDGWMWNELLALYGDMKARAQT